MLFGRLLDECGKDTGTEIRADMLSKDEYRALTKAGRICCPGCDAKLVHRSGGDDLNCEPIIVDGDPEKTRMPHFATKAIEDHAAGCDFRDDPTASENIKSFREALKEGKPIQIRLNFETGFEGLRNRFNIVTQPNSGVWEVSDWEKKHPDHVAVRARDITDVLHYLTMAKAMKGQAGMKQLYFKAVDSVQSCAHFTISDLSSKITGVVREIFDRAVHSHTAQQHIQNLPGLYRFKVSSRQLQLAAQGVRMSKIFGQLYEKLAYALFETDPFKAIEKTKDENIRKALLTTEDRRVLRAMRAQTRDSDDKAELIRALHETADQTIAHALRNTKDSRFHIIMGLMKDKAASHDVKMGLELKEPSLSNITVTDRGYELWVVGTPSLLMHEIKRMREKASGIDIEKSEKPAFLMLIVKQRRAFGVVGIEDMKPRDARNALKPAQRDLFPPSQLPYAPAKKRVNGRHP